MKLRIAKGGLKVGTWNHRVIRYVTPVEAYLLIHEVHYGSDGIAIGWTADGARVGGATIKEIRETLVRMRGALLRPILRVKKQGSKEILIEESTGRRACGRPVSQLSDKERGEMRFVAAIVSQEVKKAQKLERKRKRGSPAPPA